MEIALRARLSGLAQTVDWGLRPQQASLPAIILNKVGSQKAYTMDGPQGMQQHRVRIECWATTFKAAHETASQVIAELEQASGQFQAGFVLFRTDDHEMTSDGVRFRALVDMRITHIPA